MAYSTSHPYSAHRGVLNRLVSAAALGAIVLTTGNAVASWLVPVKRNCLMSGDCKTQSATCDRLIAICCCTTGNGVWVCMCSPAGDAECNSTGGWTCVDDVSIS